MTAEPPLSGLKVGRFQIKDLTVWPWLAWDLVCKLSWPRTHGGSWCFCLLSARITGMRHHVQNQHSVLESPSGHKRKEPSVLCSVFFSHFAFQSSGKTQRKKQRLGDISYPERGANYLCALFILEFLVNTDFFFKKAYFLHEILTAIYS